MSAPEHSVGALSPPVATSKPARVLSCVLCAQRKVKCDRKFPCSNCTRTGLQCVPAATIPRQRRRRFPERELLERLHHYEELLKSHNIVFEPLHTTAANHPTSLDDRSDGRSNHGPAVKRGQRPIERPRQVPATITASQASSEALRTSEIEARSLPKDFWRAMNRRVSASVVEQ